LFEGGILYQGLTPFGVRLFILGNFPILLWGFIITVFKYNWLIFGKLKTNLMDLKSFYKKIKAYYNKDGYTISINYKGHPLSATGSSEESVVKSILKLMNLVDYVENKESTKSKQMVDAV